MERAWLVALLALVSVHGARGDATVAQLSMRLGNGLTLVVAPDPSASAVAVYVSYRFGTGDDAGGDGVFAHVLERLLARGGPRARTQHIDLTLEAIDGWGSSATFGDRMSTIDVVPPGALPYALWLEADRMSVPTVVTNAEIEHELEAVAGERLATYTGTPIGLVERAIAETLWQATPNARRPLADIPARSISHRTQLVSDLAVRVLEPANATIVIAGAVTTDDARRLVTRYFSALPSGDTLARTAPAELRPFSHGGRSETVADVATRVVVAARAPRDSAELRVAAQVLVNGKRGRLIANLVTPELALEVHARVERRAIGSELVVDALVKPGADPSAVRDALVSALAELGHHPIDATELDIAKAGAEADRLRALESLAFRADALAIWADPSSAWHSRADESVALGKVSPASLLAAGSQWLDPSAIVAVIGQPR